MAVAKDDDDAFPSPDYETIEYKERDEDEEDSLPVRRLRVAAMHGILRPVVKKPSIASKAKKQQLKSFENAIESAIADASTLRRRGFSLLNQRFSLLNTSSVIHKEDFDGDRSDNTILPKVLLRRMKEFNTRGYKNKMIEKYIRLAIAKMGSPTLTVGVLGRIKCGKSTLLNAITHSDLFPTDSCNPETSVIVSIHHNSSVHVGPCNEDDRCHGKGLKCPQLQNSMGVTIATTSYQIQRKLSAVNEEARKRKDKEQYFAIVVNIPALAKLRTAIDIVLQDTPGLGEAASEHGSTHIADLAETALLTCSAYIYVLDCSKLRDQLDVAALQLLKTKDHGVFQDGRLMVAANQLDRTIQPQPGQRQKNVSSIQRVQKNVQDMLQNDIYEEVPACLIVTSVAYWSWFTRIIQDSQYSEEMNLWRKQYERAFEIPRDRKVTSKQFIEDVSGIKHIEEWLNIVSLYSESILQKSKLSDAVYCSSLSINACDNYMKKLEVKIEELVADMETKKNMWNDAITLIHDIETQLEMFRSVLEAAYECDIQAPKQRMLGLAAEKLAAFQDSCCSKCRQGSFVNESEREHTLQERLDVDSTESEENQRDGNTTDYDSDSSSSDDDLFWDRISTPTSPQPSQTLSLILPSSPSNQEPEHNLLPTSIGAIKYYQVKDFRRDLHQFIHELENAINDYLETVRFMCIPNSIPLEEFGENKKQLYQFATNFLHTKISVTSRGEEDHPEVSVYAHPKPDEIQGILTNQEISMNQLRERTEIKMLKLGWLGRIKVWFKAKFKGVPATDTKENYIMRRSDVISAIRYLREKKCLDECSKYLDVHVKDQIVECYHRTFTQHVRNFLQEYNDNCLTLMSEISSNKEEDMRRVLQQAKQASEELNYLIHSNFVLQQLKDEVRLDLLETFKDLDMSMHEV